MPNVHKFRMLGFKHFQRAAQGIVLRIADFGRVFLVVERVVMADLFGEIGVFLLKLGEVEQGDGIFLGHYVPVSSRRLSSHV